MKISNDEMYSRISAQALKAAEELRDVGDGPEKVEILKKGCLDLVDLLNKWEITSHCPIEGRLYDVLFGILSDAESYAELSRTKRQKTIHFMKKALRLRVFPGTQGRETAVKFFNHVGLLAGNKREKLLPKP